MAVWNDWRRQNPAMRPDLSNANLRSSSSYDLDDPYDKYLNDADFQESNLCNSDLSGVCLVGANFALADLSRSRLQNANLNLAIFHNAKLISTNLDYSAIIRSDFTGAQFGEVHLFGLDLSVAIGLEKIYHLSPSEIDLSTLEATAKGLLGQGVATAQRSSIDHFLRCSGNADLIEILNERLGR